MPVHHPPVGRRVHQQLAAAALRHAADDVAKALDRKDDGQSAAKAAESLQMLVQKKIDEQKLLDTGELQQEVAALRSFLPAPH